MTFGKALDLMKQGRKVRREGWNGKGMHVALTGSTLLNCSTVMRDFIYMKAADGLLVPWTASQTDVLAEDWLLVEAKSDF